MVNQIPTSKAGNTETWPNTDTLEEGKTYTMNAQVEQTDSKGNLTATHEEKQVQATVENIERDEHGGTTITTTY